MLELGNSSVLFRREQPEKVAGGSGEAEGRLSTQGEALPCCPHCRRSWPEAPRIAIDRDTGRVSANGAVVKLSRTQLNIFARLARNIGTVVYRDQLLFCMYGALDKDEPETGDLVLKTTITHLRRKLDPLGLTVANLHSTGYRLVEEPWRKGNSPGRKPKTRTAAHA